MNDFIDILNHLVSSNVINDDQYSYFISRGMQYEKFGSDYPILQSIFPNGIPIGASPQFIENLNFPYQETSFVCANTGNTFPKTYLYKTNMRSGGVMSLLSGRRPIGDTVYASLNRIILGSKAILFSADNLIANLDQIWDWNYFGKYLQKNNSELYDELSRFASKRCDSVPVQVILARKKSTFIRLNFLEKYLQNQLSIFNSPLINVVILTNTDGFDYVSKTIRPSKNIHYISETLSNGDVDIVTSLKKLRKKFGIKKMLNDGGRKMSNGMKDLNLLGGERISYEPYPGKKYIPNKISSDMIFGKDGDGVDGSAVADSITVFSQETRLSKKETLSLHLYQM